MQEALRAALLAGPATVKEIANQIGKSESRVRELLKADQSEIHSKKEDGRGNVFWLPEARAEGTPATTQADAAGDTQGQELLDQGFTAGSDGQAVAPEGATDPVVPITTCPFCQNEDKQTQAGPDGTFLGAANTCGECGKTYNKFSGDEIQAPAKAEKGKRKPLNPQYKIDAKVTAVEAEGGKVSFDREAREWVLSHKSKGIVSRMTAKEFSIETPESLVAKIA